MPPLVQSHDLLVISIARSWLGCPPWLMHTDIFAGSLGPMGAGLRSAFLGWVLTDFHGHHFRSKQQTACYFLTSHFNFALGVTDPQPNFQIPLNKPSSFMHVLFSSLCGLHNSKVLVPATSQTLLPSGHSLLMILSTHREIFKSFSFYKK